MGSYLQFAGATRTVTGTKHLLQHRGKVVMLDCGLFQGLKELRVRNWEPFPLPAGYVDDIILSHAHIDHAGFLLRFFAHGFDGRIFATPSTQELCEIMLPDSAHIQEEDARYANKEGFSKHAPAEPLYTTEDAEGVLQKFQSVPYGTVCNINKNIGFDFVDAGHILGSAIVRLTMRREDDSTFRLVFSGDLGRYGESILPDPAAVQDADFLILESTYGDRIHQDVDVQGKLGEIINRTCRRGGKVVIPAFAVGRTQEILYQIRTLQEGGHIPKIPVYIDSPLAIKATKIFCEYPERFDPEVSAGARRGDCRILCHNLRVASTVQDSMAINSLDEPLIIISASGMCEAGRILHHLKLKLPDKRNTVVFVGYQAEGTRGRRILDGEREVKIHGEMVPVRAEIRSIEAFSAHADVEEIFRWLGNFKRPPRMTFLVHGEWSQMQALEGQIRERLGWPVQTPAYLQKVDLEQYLPPMAGE
jgi:metallo-beta-lactamase family protein